MTDPDTQAPKPQYPMQWAGREVIYHGPATSHHGRYTVYHWRYCFTVPCDPSCTGFDYVLAPLDPAAVGLKPGDGILTHPGHMTPADLATRETPPPPPATHERTDL